MVCNILRPGAVALLAVLLAAGCSSVDITVSTDGDPPAAAAAATEASPTAESAPKGAPEVVQTVELSSSVFSRIRRIPLRHACTEMKDIVRPTTDPTVKKSENFSPPLSWTGAARGYEERRPHRRRHRQRGRSQGPGRATRRPLAHMEHPADRDRAGRGRRHHRRSLSSWTRTSPRASTPTASPATRAVSVPAGRLLHRRPGLLRPEGPARRPVLLQDLRPRRRA